MLAISKTSSCQIFLGISVGQHNVKSSHVPLVIFDDVAIPSEKRTATIFMLVVFFGQVRTADLEIQAELKQEDGIKVY